MLRTLIGGLFLAACAANPPAAPEPAGDAPARTEVVPAPAPPAAADTEPAGVAHIRPLLLARHADDVPDRSVLEQHPHPVDSLRWLGTHDEQILVRARALDALGQWDTDDNAAFLVAVVADASALGKLRAAAALGLGRTDVGSRLWVQDALLAATRGDDLRLALDAVGVLRPVDGAAMALGALTADPEVAPAVREAAAQ